MPKWNAEVYDMHMVTPEFIIDLRKDLGETADVFGARFGVTGNTVFRWEQGVRHPKYDMQIELNELRDELNGRVKQTA